jgi:uncharacterized membrane-anchored protein
VSGVVTSCHVEETAVVSTDGATDDPARGAPGAVASQARPALARLDRPHLSKVPQVTAMFWVIKVLTTGMGETTSDFFAHTIGPVIAVSLAGLALVGAVLAQLRADRYRPWVYWSAVVLVSVFGTMAADVVHIGLGVPYVVSTVVFAVVLAVVLVGWYRSEGTLSIHSITTPRREAYYWTTVLTTFALGTAAGDMTATTMGWGYLTSGIVFAVLLAVPAVGHARLGLGPILAFWTAYVLTRPVGASFADWIAVPPARGGLDWGTGRISLALLVAIVLLVGRLARTHRDVEPVAAA